MRVDRSLKFATILAALAACSTPAATPDAAPPAAAAPAPAPVVESPAPVATPAISLNATWDSRPLDIEYRREQQNMDARFKIEISTPRAGESRDVRDRRQADERRALDLRYSHGKASHARGLPPQ